MGESINNFIELYKKEAELALAVVWEKLEAKRSDLRDEYRKMKNALQDCEDKLAAQIKLTSAAKEETAKVRWELEASQHECGVLSAENARLATIVTHTLHDLTRVKSKVEKVKAELESLLQLAITSQGPMIDASLYKLVRTQAFGDYITACASALNHGGTTNTIEMISLDYP